MKWEYKTVDVGTIKGIEQAERLKEQGWNVVCVGTRTILLERKAQ